ncbi:metalloregulator ArsR/SmtB family transcription factor [Nocardia sp. CA-084685]|uniref:metalloregulator ArsR/SmtB family transcription factor n=1 Tax=Nocardia sp. CA-084685 TaxID=3239970 RepID=UPI003D98ACF4
MSISELPLVGVAASSCAVTPMVHQPLSADEAAALAGVFKALADPVRLRLMSVVASHGGQEVCVCELSDGFDISQPTVSHHLRVLREAGLLSSERRGSWVYYRVEPTALQQLSRLLDGGVSAVAR